MFENIFDDNEITINLNSPIRTTHLNLKECSLNTVSQNEGYSRPSKISNKSIWNYDFKRKIYILKKELNELYDYVLIHPKWWAYLNAWYGWDFDVLV